MADTTAYLEAEAWVRERSLPELFSGQEFHERQLQIGVKSDGQPAYHRFDAVSEDGKIVVAVKSGSGRTSGNKAPTGQVKDAFNEVLFLSLVSAQRRILAFTDSRLFKAFSTVSDGRLPMSIELRYFELPEEVKAKLIAARKRASAEVSPRGR